MALDGRTKLAAFAAGLGVALVAGLGLGTAFGPEPDDPPVPAHGPDHGTEDDGRGH
jgi:hypothetical protein